MEKDIQLNQAQLSRRNFVMAGATVSATAMVTLATAQDSQQGASPSQKGRDIRSSTLPTNSLLKKGDVVLFQGDSITFAERDRDKGVEPNVLPALGTGYASLIAAQLLVGFPGADLKFYNRGIGGNTISDLTGRWQADCLDLKPNVLSILIGVNDFFVLHRQGVAGDPKKYQSQYQALLKRTKDALPDVKLVICEPFGLTIGTVDASWEPVYGKYREVAKRVADEFDARFVPFQSMFDAALKIAPASFWASDGVHPSMHGAALMCDWWCAAVEA